MTHVGAAAIAVNLHPAHRDVAEVDRCGNPLPTRSLPLAVEGRRQDQVMAARGEAVAQAKAAGKPRRPAAAGVRGGRRRRWCPATGAGPQRPPPDSRHPPRQ